MFVILIWAVCVTAASRLVLWQQEWSAAHEQGTDILEAWLGESRSVLSDMMFVKADEYFHKGFYPGIFDRVRPDAEGSHMVEHMHAGGSETDSHEEEYHDLPEFGPEGGDWISRFGRYFHPSEHQHLEKAGEASEILPWLRFSAELDANRVQTYVVGAYWLRAHMGKVKEAERFLREGLNANPGNPEILFELGRIFNEEQNDPAKARNLFLAAWRNLKNRADGKEMDEFLAARILSSLSLLEENAGNLSKALEYMRMWKQYSPVPDRIQERIDAVEEKLSDAPAAGVEPPNPVGDRS